MLACEDNNLVELRQVCQEVVDAGTFGSSPAVLSLQVTLISSECLEIRRFDVRPKWMSRANHLRRAGACKVSDEAAGVEEGEVQSISVS